MIVHDEASARKWLLSTCHVSRETELALDRFELLLRADNRRHNLVSPASLDHLWRRHIADSAQLLRFNDPGGTWLDLGSGAGFPGLIVAALGGRPVTLVEARSLRVGFLRRAAEVLGVASSVTIWPTRIEVLPPQPFDVISARAFAPLPNLLELAHPFSTETTRWILPKGRSAQSELATIASSWHGRFRLEASVTDDNAGIIVADGVGRRTRSGVHGRVKGQG